MLPSSWVTVSTAGKRPARNRPVRMPSTRPAKIAPVMCSLYREKRFFGDAVLSCEEFIAETLLVFFIFFIIIPHRKEDKKQFHFTDEKIAWRAASSRNCS